MNYIILIEILVDILLINTQRKFLEALMEFLSKIEFNKKDVNQNMINIMFLRFHQSYNEFV